VNFKNGGTNIMWVVINKKFLEKIKQLYHEQGLYTPQSAKQWEELIELLIYEGLVTALNLSQEKVKELFKNAKLIFLLILCSSLLFATHYVNLNTATEKELLSVPGITPQVTNAILVYRQKYGDFKTVSEIYNACWEMSLPVSEDYVKYLTKNAKIYAVSVENWGKGLADTRQDLINPTVCYYKKDDLGGIYVFKLYDGGVFIVLTRSVLYADVDFLRNCLEPKFLSRPIIDWVVVTKSNIDFSLLERGKIRNLYLPKGYKPVSKSVGKNIVYVNKDIEIDCLQSYSFFAFVEPVKNYLRVVFCYEDPCVIISPSSEKDDLGVLNPGPKDENVFMFDGVLFYYPQRGKIYIKRPRKSVVAEEQKERMYEEIKERVLQEIEDAYER